MGKTRERKKIEGYKKQIEKHIEKFNEAKEREDEGSMNYMAKELRSMLEEMEKHKIRSLPRKERLKKKC